MDILLFMEKERLHLDVCVFWQQKQFCEIT